MKNTYERINKNEFEKMITDGGYKICIDNKRLTAYASPEAEFLVMKKDRKVNENEVLYYFSDSKLLTSINNAGYALITIGKTSTVHSLVATAFLGKKPKGMEVLHGKNGKSDNTLKNLRYGTHSENMKEFWAERKRKLAAEKAKK